MKKPNRIARKGDTARNRAQVKHRALTPAKSIRKAARIPSARKPAKPKPSPEAAFAAAIGLKESPHGEHVCEVEHGPGAHQTLYRRGDEFTIVNSCLSVRAGRVWRTWEEWSEINPGVFALDLPADTLRWQEFPEKCQRGEVVAWLFENFGSVAIPEDFAEDFRPLGITGQPSKKQVHASFCRLAEIALKDRPEAEEPAIGSLDLMVVAVALGLKDEGAEAATIFNARNQAVIAENALRGMIDSVLRPSGGT